MSDNIERCVDCRRLFKTLWGISELRCPKCKYLREKEAAETAKICKNFFANENKLDNINEAA